MIRLIVLALLLVSGCRTAGSDQAASEPKVAEAAQPAVKPYDPARYAADAELATAELAKRLCSCVFVQRFETSYCASNARPALEGLAVTPSVDLARSRVTVQSAVSGIQFAQPPAAPIMAAATFAFEARRPEFGCSVLKVVPPLP